MQIYQAIIDTPFSQLGIKTQNEAVVSIDFLPVNTEKSFTSSSLTECLVHHLQCYLNSPDHHFEIPLLATGTPFQQSVWKIMRTIEAGKTLTYGEVAMSLNSSPRAVGNACRRNPIPLLIPCHRIVAKDGLGGFAGQTNGAVFNIKRWLLMHESRLRNENTGINGLNFKL
ncbi:MAG: methylated-DNA--[protein]-cysteine S-methyltransferase [Gammaproteobacteria bacterium]|nr:methylated-DNA--[protein]-cysteine S-methyltransferase [Gammaproteobacteria bacterium]